jgi:hypothetical protein
MVPGQHRASDSRETSMRFISKRGIAATGIVASLCIAGSAGSASASGSVLNAQSGDVVHQCVQVGHDNLGNQGVVCVDLDTYMTSDGHEDFPAVQAKMEIVCENNEGAEVECAEAHEFGLIANAATGAGTRHEFDCGHQWPACSGGHNGGRDVINIGNDYFPEEGTTTCDFAYINSVWAVVFGQDSQTSIELPGSGEWVYLSSATANDSGNESTGHYYICP